MLKFKFLDKKTAKKYFIKCDYLKKIGSQEINLRSTRYMKTAVTRIELMENYFDSVLSFSSEEKMYIEKFHKKAISLLFNVNYIAKNEEYVYMKVHGTLDWYNSFVISENCIILPFRLFYNTQENEFLKNILSCIIYCNQQEEKNYYDGFYNNLFGFEKIDENKIIVLKDEKRIITNPNGLQREWIINLCDGFYLPCLLLHNEELVSCLLPLKKFSDYYVTKSEPIIASTREDYVNLTCCIDKKEKLDHPNEIFASFLMKKIFFS